MVGHAFHSSNDGRKLKIGGSWSKLAWAKARAYLINNQSKKDQRHGQVAKHLPSKLT
jgi:hypothetical protein